MYLIKVHVDTIDKHKMGYSFIHHFKLNIFIKTILNYLFVNCNCLLIDVSN